MGNLKCGDVEVKVFRQVGFPEGMDSETANLCEAMNVLPGITTIESCCGQGENSVDVWFMVDGSMRGLFFLTWCVDIRYWKHGCSWSISLSVGDTMHGDVLPTIFRLSSGDVRGQEACRQASDLVRNLNLHLNHAAFLKGFGLSDIRNEVAGIVVPVGEAGLS